MGIAQGVPFVFLHHPDGGWKDTSSFTVYCISSYYGGHQTCLSQQSKVTPSFIHYNLCCCCFLFHANTLPYALQGLPQLDVRIKWPNDLYLNGLKVGGILCTSTYKSNKFNVSAGKILFTYLVYYF